MKKILNLLFFVCIFNCDGKKNYNNINDNNNNNNNNIVLLSKRLRYKVKLLKVNGEKKKLWTDRLGRIGVEAGTKSVLEWSVKYDKCADDRKVGEEVYTKDELENISHNSNTITARAYNGDEIVLTIRPVSGNLDPSWVSSTFSIRNGKLMLDLNPSAKDNAWVSIKLEILPKQRNKYDNTEECTRRFVIRTVVI